MATVESAPTPSAPSTAVSSACATNALGQQCVGSERLLQTIFNSGVIDANRQQTLLSLVSSRNISEKELTAIVQLVGRIKHAQENGANLASGMTAAQGKEFLNCLINEVANPAEINQGMHAGCTVISMMFDKARRDPAGLLLMGVDLASKGTASLKNGDTLHINETAFAEALNDKNGQYEKVSLSERVLMASLMDYGNGGSSSYNFQIDQSTGFSVGGKTLSDYKGLYPHQYLRVANALEGGVHKIETDKARAWAHLRSGNPPGSAAVGTLIDMRWNSSGAHVNHMVTFMGFDKNGDAIIRNPWGAENPPSADGPKSRRARPDLGKGYETISAKELEERLNGITVKDTSPGARAMTAAEDKNVRLDLESPQENGLPRTLGPEVAVRQFTEGKKSSVRELTESELAEFKKDRPDYLSVIKAEEDRRKRIRTQEDDPELELRRWSRPTAPVFTPPGKR